MKNVQDLFQNTYVVNLERRPDRLQSFSEKMERMQLPFQVFKAVDGNEIDYPGPLKKGEEGCRRSHFDLIKQEMFKNSPNVLILEDDCCFHENFINELTNVLPQIPANTDMLYFGGNHKHTNLVPVAPNVFKTSHTYTTHAMFISQRVYKILLDSVQAHPTYPVDVCFACMHPGINAYVLQPPLIWQEIGFSDVQEGMRDYTWEILS